MRALRLTALAGLFGATATPLVVATPFFRPFWPRAGIYFPFVEPKAAWLWGCLALAIACWTVLAVHHKSYRLFSPVTVALLAFLAVIAWADAHALAPRIAFWGRPERMDGYLTLALVFGAAVTAGRLLDTAALRRRYAGAHVVVSILVAALGLLQYAGSAHRHYPGFQVSSTLGNPVYLAQYAVLMLCLIAWLWAQTGGTTRIALGAAALGNFTMLALSQGRGGILALLAALAVGALCLHRQRRLLLLVAASVLVVLVVLPICGILPHGTYFFAVNFSDVRFVLWRYALDLAHQHPFFGWGQDGLFVAGGWYQHWDRAHNMVLDWLVAGGIAGLLSWVWVLAALRLEIEQAFIGVERAALYGFLAAYIVSDMTLFDNLTTYALLSGVIGLISAQWQERWDYFAWRHDLPAAALRR